MAIEVSLSIYVLASVLLLLAYVILRHIETRTVYAHEPPAVSSGIPFLGHLILMLSYGSQYFKHLGTRCKGLPIFTLPILNGRTYIVTDPGLAAAVQRASKALSFAPLVPEIIHRVLGFDDAITKELRADVEREDGGRGYIREVQDLVVSALSPGESLDELTVGAADQFLEWLDEYSQYLRKNHSDGASEDFLLWIQHLVATCTAEFLFGPENPIAVHPELEEAFWRFDRGIPLLLLGLFPSLTARKAYYGREALVEAFVEYLKLDRQKLGSRLTQGRFEIAKRRGVSINNAARSDLSFLFAGITNTAGTSFWLALRVFSCSELLQAVRSELDNALNTEPEMPGRRRFNVKQINKQCPTLVSAFRETLRFYSDNASTRLVTADTMLANKYYLRAGSILQVTGAVMHADNVVWGDDAADFNPYRFVESSTGTIKVPHAVDAKVTAKNSEPDETAKRSTAKQSKQVHPAAFRAFGGGSTLCPGRHFALNEIVGLVAMIIMKLDIKSADGSELKLPQKKDNVVPIHILEPTERVMVNISLRKGWEDVQIILEH